MPTSEGDVGPTILLTGGSGYVGGRLIPRLEQQRVKLRCLARDADKLRSLVKATTEIVQGDVLDQPSLDRALSGVHTAFYLVHLMSGSKDFERDDRQAATNFGEAAQKAGVRRIIYLGGLGDDSLPDLSPHFRTALDRRAEEPHRGPRSNGDGCVFHPTDGSAGGHPKGARRTGRICLIGN